MTEPAGSGVGATWVEASRGFAEEVTAYYEQHDGATPAAIEGTIATNTTLVPKRAKNLSSLMSALTGRASLADARVLELGSGFGALAGYLAWSEHPARYFGIDSREDYAEAASRSVAALGLTPGTLAFDVADMRDLSALDDDGFDVVLLNNSFIYLPTRREEKQALREIHRVCAPGGHVVLYHANRWVRNEPFTGAPYIHLLGPRSGRAVAAVTGWEHNHGRVRLLSPPEMRRRLRRAGFGSVQVATYAQGGPQVGPKAARHAKFYAAAGQKPAV